MVSIGSGEEGMLIGLFEVIVTSKPEEETVGSGVGKTQESITTELM